ncbi:MAG TPA: hypothetical protein VMF05_10870 [Stellaceae bacterium]|nr:hypothetical protein [Stellaceae bacterium]
MRLAIVAMMSALMLFTGIANDAWAQRCPTHGLLQIAAAIKASSVAASAIKSRSCMWAAAARMESGGGRLCAHNSNNFGVLQLSRENIVRLGLTPAQYMAASLQDQIDGWAMTAADNNHSRGYKEIDQDIADTLRFGYVMDGVLAACSQFGPTICNHDMDLIEHGIALPLRGGNGAIPCKDWSCAHGTANQDGNGQTIVSWGLVIEGEIHNSQCVD